MGIIFRLRFRGEGAEPKGAGEEAAGGAIPARKDLKVS